MKLRVLVSVLLFAFLACGASHAEFKIDKIGVNYVDRHSAALDNHYLQYQAAVSLNKYLNPSIGLEHDQTEGEVRRYYVGNRFALTDKNGVVIRYNHLEYPDWEIGENVLNLYWDYMGRRLFASAGMSYHAYNMFNDEYNNVMDFEGEIDQVRINVAVSYGMDFFKDRMGFRIGINNFNEFENFDTMAGFNEFGGFIDVHTQVVNNLYLNFMYEPRLIGLSGGHPVLGRETWMMGLSYRQK